MDLTPLFGLRLRTPRLELRLPETAELDALREVALRGIHPPEFMPFTIAWTDDPELAEFRAYHEMRRRDWRVDEWHLELGVFVEGEPAGIQAVESKEFARTQTVGTGSWLGRRFQGRGVGTEMRTAALELAFRGLGARLARSGAVDGNIASLRVSEKLGYREIGRGTVAPRGVELQHTDVALRREDWRPPVAVEIEGLEPCLPLFGAGPAPPG
ncbi:MAG TPA: GNAT family protein [Gaiellaceae bacterium]|jgi:RimJ/RimL family protein N-acetyltransferase